MAADPQSVHDLQPETNDELDSFYLEALSTNTDTNSHESESDNHTTIEFETESEPVVTDEQERFEASPELFTFVLETLKTNESTSTKWQNADKESILELFTTESKASTLRHIDLNVIYEGIRNVLPQRIQVFRKSWKKDMKVIYLCALLGRACIPEALITKKARRLKRRNPQTLRKLAIRLIGSKKYPKAALAASYAAHLWPDVLEEWQEQAPFPSPTKIEGSEENISYWFSYPERRANGKLLGKSLDCSHNLTHLRVRTSTTGICGSKSDAWKACARSKATKLTVPLVEDLVDKQNVPNARTHFSQEVEDWMLEHGFESEGNLTKIVRNWYEASDAPGMPAIQRVSHLLTMRNFLLNGVDFSKFPPQWRYFNGIPSVSFEGILLDIDTKLQMYRMTSTYNIRSVGSLAAETTVGILQAMYPTYQVSIKARDVPGLISSVVEVMTCKTNPDRGFRIRTSRTSGIYPQHEADGVYQMEEGSTIHMHPDVFTLIPRDHEFDRPERKRKSKRRIRFGQVSGPMAPSRGALPVRHYHRKDESKILPTKRLGIDME